MTTELLGLLVSHGIAIAFGFFIGRYFKRKNDSEWQAKYESANTEKIQLNKDFKKEKKRINRLQQERNAWQNKHQTLTVEHEKTAENLTTTEKTVAEQLATCDQLNTELDRLKNRFQNLDKEYQKLKERYDTDMHDSRNWKSKRTALEREIETLKGNWSRSENDKNKAQEKLKDYLKQINDFELLKKSHRSLNQEYKTLRSNLRYWETQHYEVNQELQLALKTVDIQRKENLGLKEDIRAAITRQEELHQQVLNFKKKFVDTNNKYQELMRA